MLSLSNAVLKGNMLDSWQSKVTAVFVYRLQWNWSDLQSPGEYTARNDHRRMSEWGKLFWVQGKFHCCNWHKAGWGSSAARSVHQGHTSTVCAFVCVCVCVIVCLCEAAINGLVNGGHCLKVSLFSCYPLTAWVHFHKMSLLLNEIRFYFQSWAEHSM